MVNREYHVASFVVSAQPQHVAEIAARIEATNGLEVHAEEHGKLIVTAEADNVRELAEMAAGLEEMQYTLAVASAYHEYAADEESTLAVSRESE